MKQATKLKIHMKGLREIQRPLNLKISDYSDLDSLQQRIQTCTKCSLCELDVNKLDLEKGFGKLPIKKGRLPILFVGINPSITRFKDSMSVGAFTGRTSGDLFKLLLSEISLNVDDFYITNLVRCSTPNNRELTYSDIYVCSGYLLKEIYLIQPKVIFSLGSIVSQWLKNNKEKIRSVCKTDFIYLQHPNHLKYSPNEKEKYLKELSKVKEYMK